MTKITLPNNWKPRGYQMPAWEYLENGGRHAELVWHRRSGKDEVGMHHTACSAFQRVATYWYMLPEAAQARKAVWDAINPHTGRRRIDEAFPLELRSSTRDHEMMIKFVNGSTWQVLGSDNFNSLVGSPPAGIVYSEWALANPTSRAYLRPIIAENGGWQIFNTTPRGNNHAKRTFDAAKNESGAFAQLLTVRDTGAMSAEQIERELQIYIDDFGIDAGTAKFEQEYMCSFDAALLGAYYGSEMRLADQSGRICSVPHDPSLVVYTAWDIGYSDDTGIWFYQLISGEVHVLEYYGASGKDPRHYFEQITGKKIINDDWFMDGKRPIFSGDVDEAKHRQAYKYDMHYLPHDARAKTFTSMGRSLQEMALKCLGDSKINIVPDLSVQDGIQAARNIISRSYFDADKCSDGIDSLKQYQREWDDNKKDFRERPRHDWTSHAADAFRMLAISAREKISCAKNDAPKFNDAGKMTFNELVMHNRRLKKSRE